MNSAEKNNRVYLNGEIVSEAAFSHEVYGEGFYEMSVLVKRLSGQADILPVTISERLIQDKQLGIGSEISAIGQFRSYNKLVDGKSKLMLTVFVRELLEGEAQKNPNSIVLSGYICKQPVYRTTPFNREIADLLVAVNRSYNKSDYIPCIAWGRNARFVKISRWASASPFPAGYRAGNIRKSFRRRTCASSRLTRYPSASWPPMKTWITSIWMRSFPLSACRRRATIRSISTLPDNINTIRDWKDRRVFTAVFSHLGIRKLFLSGRIPPAGVDKRRTVE